MVNISNIQPLDFARAGRLGIGTPQANPTVEAEINPVVKEESASSDKLAEVMAC